MSDKLVDRDVQQVVLDSQVSASCVNFDTFFVVNKDDLGAELSANCVIKGLLRTSSVKVDLVYAAEVVGKDSSKAL